MNKIVGLIVCLLLVLCACNSDKLKESNQKEVRKIKATKEKDLKINVKELLSKASQLEKEEKHTEAIASIDEAIKLEGESRKILGFKYEILMKMEKYDQALAVALKRDEVAKRKSPWNCISIAEVYLKLNNSEKALEYLALAINERKFINLNYLKGNIYFVLKDNEKFLMLLDTIKKNTGIGKNAKGFAVNLLNGKKIKLSDYKGRVVLIDFWAVWCPPCIEEIPFLKELYSENKDKGFEIIGISLDTDEKKLNDFLKEKAIDWRISYSGKGWYDDTAKLYNVSSIPSTWIIDKSGNLRYFDIHKEDMKKAVVKLINEQIE